MLGKVLFLYTKLKSLMETALSGSWGKTGGCTEKKQIKWGKYIHMHVPFKNKIKK